MYVSVAGGITEVLHEHYLARDCYAPFRIKRNYKVAEESKKREGDSFANWGPKELEQMKKEQKELWKKIIQCTN